MAIDVIQFQAEAGLLALIEEAERQSVMMSAVVFYCSQLTYTPAVDEFLLTVKPALKDKQDRGRRTGVQPVE